MSFAGETFSRGKMNWSDYWNQVLSNIFSFPNTERETSDPIRSSTADDHASKRIILLGMMAASEKAAIVPNI